jgi:hypothetical protein
MADSKRVLVRERFFAVAEFIFGRTRCPPISALDACMGDMTIDRSGDKASFKFLSENKTTYNASVSTVEMLMRRAVSSSPGLEMPSMNDLKHAFDRLVRGRAAVEADEEEEEEEEEDEGASDSAATMRRKRGRPATEAQNLNQRSASKRMATRATPVLSPSMDSSDDEDEDEDEDEDDEAPAAAAPAAVPAVAPTVAAVPAVPIPVVERDDGHAALMRQALTMIQTSSDALNARLLDELTCIKTQLVDSRVQLAALRVQLAAATEQLAALTEQRIEATNARTEAHANAHANAAAHVAGAPPEPAPSGTFCARALLSLSRGAR